MPGRACAKYWAPGGAGSSGSSWARPGSNAAAAVLAVGLLGLTYPALAEFSGSAMTWADLSWLSLLIFLAASVLVVGLAVGCYPR